MIKAVISGDIISSTSLNDAGRALIEDSLKELLDNLKKVYNVYGRIIKGDYLECVVSEPQNALQVALAIKSFIKSIPVIDTVHYKMNSRIKLFKTYGIRLAIGYGEISRFDPERGIIDGEAIYLSGRTINESTYNKKRVIIKNTLHFASNDEMLNKNFGALLALLDILISKATAKQCKVLYLKLMNNNENTIALKLNISQSVVNQHSKSIGWNAIEKAVEYYSEVIKNG
ncbi:MAG: fumarate hydratase [Bacteroidetes bacterium 4484_249]|nr:MAG: fumarate hydratase [Bacteroidetes bacterium 4484_249]